jgi:mono/diheme cytochrome c family protein
VAAPAAVVAQIDQGAALFQRNCAQCHGARGEGSTAAPALIGAQALPMNPPAGARLRRTTFRAGKDLGMFIMTTMPPQGAKLPPTQVACVLAWLLHQNGATPQQTVSPATAGSMPIHGSR